MNNIKYTLPFLMLILFVPVAMSDTFAQGEPGEDSTDKIGPVGTVNESADIKLQEIEEKQQDLKNKHHAINEEFNSTNSTKKITELKSDYIQTVKELNTLSYVEPERNYLAEWTALDAQIIILEELQWNNYTEPRQVMIDGLYEQMNEIEQESIASMVLDPADKTKLYNLEMELHNKYSNPDHETFVSNEFVEYAYVDHVQEKVFLVIDENKALAENGISSILVAQNVMDAVGIDNITIDFAEITPLRCNSVTSDCDPLIGGISIGRADSPNDHSGTIGFRAKDSSNNKGFVTAGHAVQFEDFTNTVMHQPHTSTSIIGTIPSNGDDVCYTGGGVDKGERTINGKPCDFAFVKTARGVSINDDIYKSPNRTYDINALAIPSDQVRGTMLKLVGSNSGTVTGSIQTILSISDRVLMTVHSPAIAGDSGGPVFKSSTGARNTSTAEIFGIVLSSHGIARIMYEPVDKIMTELNLRPYH